MTVDNRQLLNAVSNMLSAAGLTPADLLNHADTTNSPWALDGLTLASYVARVEGGLTENTARSYATHFRHLVDGVPRQCSCRCEACVREFSVMGCCECQCGKCAKAQSFPAQGSTTLSPAALRAIDLDLLIKLIEEMAVKRVMNANVTRARRGLSPKLSTGQGARELAVAAMRRLFGRLQEEGYVNRNLALGISKGRRNEPQRRALTDAELNEVFNTVVSGGDDPYLDFGLTWSEFELGARRGGILNLTVGSLDQETQLATLREKGNRLDTQPCSADLIQFLLDFAKLRGGDQCDPTSSNFNPNAAVFYFKDSTPEEPHPVTGRRFDTLHQRIQLALPWANSMHYSGHALRHTFGTMVERQAGYETAKRALRHSNSSTTDTYVKAGPIDVAKAVAALTGKSHPLAQQSSRAEVAADKSLREFPKISECHEHLGLCAAHPANQTVA